MRRPDLPALPTEIYADPGHRNWYFREKKPDSVARYIRADLARPTLTQALALPEVKALVEALEAKTVMDPNNSNSTWLDAQARAALAALSTPPADGDKA